MARDVVSVHALLVIGGYAACGIMFGFAILLVFLSPGPTDPKTGALRYISEGMQSHCGFTAAVMGTCSLFLFACQVMVGSHLAHNTAILWAMVQVVGWNVVLGILDTGWAVHYVGLALFLMGNVGFNFIVSRDPQYGGPWYVWANSMTILAVVIFTLLFAVSAANGSEPTAQSFAVAFEFVLLFAITTQNLCLVNALGESNEDIHICFCGGRNNNINNKLATTSNTTATTTFNAHPHSLIPPPFYPPHYHHGGSP
jgi:hypothetical protein